ncbi:hypothetical protein V2S66_30415 [Streptomyces sp. V4-01]|uniref:VCBS repeat-containing protein n=1 Tax=Actinacidiphila polyblastidii TaxID=3110430 RepID=A0ABU7PKA7_9ACTN|nr:hypothetical protein [Streptomyces sp. V4-01]
MTAATQARETGEPTQVAYATDAYSVLTANPDGTFLQEMSASPQRVQKDGAWLPLDATPHRNEDGTYSTAATTASLTLSGGGTTPLAAMNDGGKQLEFSWPTALPTPSVSGSTAVYSNVLPDVDLSVQANVQGGFSDTIIIKTAQAAQNPALSTLNLTTSTTGVTLSADSAGNLSAIDESGTLIFHAPSPVMWDSTTSATSAATPAVKSMGISAQAEAGAATPDEGPGPGSQVAAVGVQLLPGVLQLTPSAILLTADDTTYPVYIDPDPTPTWVPGSTKSADYTYIQSGHPDTSNWDANTSYDTHGIGVGYQGYDSPTGTERSFYQFNVGTGIDAKTIKNATLTVDETYTASFGCDTHDVKAYSMASHIDSSSTWNNFNGRTATFLDSQPIGGAYNTGCAGAFSSAFTVTSSLSSDGDGVVTLELVGNESDRDLFKRFAKTATLSYLYNTIPNMPTALAAAPVPQNAPGDTTQGCNATGPWGWIPKGGSGGYVTLAGKISDPDASHNQLAYGQFALWDDSTPGGATAIISLGSSPGGALDSNSDEGWQGSGSTAHKRVATTNLVNGHLYGWLMRTNDGINYSDSTTACHFRYDSSAPTGVTINNSNTSSGSCTDGGTLGVVGTSVRLPIAGTDAESGLHHFDWTLGAASDLASDGGTLLVPGFPLTLTPTSWGTYFLNVAAVDNAGNESGAVCYSFYLSDNPSAHVTPGDIDGDGLPDLAAVPTAGSYPTNPGLRIFPTNALNPAGAIASNSTDGPNADNSWTGALTAHRSTPQRSTSGTTKADELWALGTNHALSLYRNNVDTPEGIAYYNNQYYSRGLRISITRPSCNACAGYAATWSSVAQLIAPGDMNGDGIPDLVTEETGGQLWFFPGNAAGNGFDTPQEIGTTSWDSYTVIAPGNTSGDNGLASLWARNKTTGSLDQYTPSKDATGKITLTKTQIGSNYTAAAYPLIISVGDISGDNIPDLIATTATGSLVDQLGTATPSTTEFDGTPGKPGRIAASGWNQIASIS